MFVSRTHSCGIRLDGVMFCWGENWSWGQLGSGGLPSNPFGEPWEVAGNLNWTSLPQRGYGTATQQYAHTCGITTNSSLWCWVGRDCKPDPDPPTAAC